MWDHFELVDITVPENSEIAFPSAGNPEIQYKLEFSIYFRSYLLKSSENIENANI